MVILPFSAMCSIVLKGYVYTIAVYFYAFRLVSSSTLHCILHHFSLHLAPFRLAFSIKTHLILLLMAQKWVLRAVF